MVEGLHIIDTTHSLVAPPTPLFLPSVSMDTIQTHSYTNSQIKEEGRGRRRLEYISMLCTQIPMCMLCTSLYVLCTCTCIYGICVYVHVHVMYISCLYTWSV